MRYLTLALLLPLAACGGLHDEDSQPSIAPNGSGSSRTFAANDFTAVELRGPDDMDVRVGSAFSVRADGDPGVLDKLRVVRDGQTLRVGRKTGFSWGSTGSAKIYVTMPRVTAASLSGSGNLAVDRIEGSGFDGALSGSGDLKIGAIAVDNAAFSISGSGKVSTDRGTARQLKISVAGSGDVDARNLVAQSAKVDVAGSGDVRATVNGPATVSIMGSSDIDLGPKAKCETHKTGSGSVRCGG
ncbi:MAG: DUF2807 domain-containing protein [Candidatus Sphingomonas colombiensis]|nr:head GIN domain-containing protein [Sphingomonas sp.]WEK44343.1 MAG: DUF2807 domain-containing protein [Sphingomonas sp.]